MSSYKIGLYPTLELFFDNLKKTSVSHDLSVLQVFTSQFFYRMINQLKSREKLNFALSVETVSEIPVLGIPNRILSCQDLNKKQIL